MTLHYYNVTSYSSPATRAAPWKTFHFSLCQQGEKKKLKILCQNWIPIPDKIRQFFLAEPPSQGHRLNTSHREGWTFLVKTWKCLITVLIKQSLPNNSSYLGLSTSHVLHCCKRQNFNKKNSLGFPSNAWKLWLCGWLHHCIETTRERIYSSALC